jgi:hypothetical protein
MAETTSGDNRTNEIVECKDCKELKKAIAIYCREELGNMCFETDQECIDYFLEFADND